MQSKQEQPVLATGETITDLEIIDLNVTGGSVARHQGQVIFLDSGLPGEKVTARILSVKKRVANAEVLEITQASAKRVQPFCPHFNLCGGCAWQDLEITAQESWKAKHVQETLKRIGKVTDINFQGLMASPASTAFRNRMSFAFAPDENGKSILGLRSKNSHDVVEVSECGLMPANAMTILEKVRTFLAENPLPAWHKGQGFLRFLVVRMPHYQPEGEQCIVECIAGKDTSPGKAYSQTLKKLGESLLEANLATGFAHSEKLGSDQVAQSERLRLSLGEINYQEKIGKLVLNIPCDAFVQTNPAAAGLLYDQVYDLAGLTGQETVWDIYCGVGGIGLYLADKAKTVRGFDWQESAIAAAKNNAAALGVSNASFSFGDLPQKLQQEKTAPDLIVVDPPRAGLDAPVLDIIQKSSAKKLIYVSCDVATQARDLTRLGSEWTVQKSLAVDMFPHTAHVESLVLLSRP